MKARTQVRPKESARKGDDVSPASIESRVDFYKNEVMSHDDVTLEIDEDARPIRQINLRGKLIQFEVGASPSVRRVFN